MTSTNTHITLDLEELGNSNIYINTYDYTSEELYIDIVQASDIDVRIEEMIVTGYEHAKLHFQNKDHIVTIANLILQGVQGSIDGNVMVEKTSIFTQQPFLDIEPSINTPVIHIIQNENEDIKVIQKLLKGINVIPGCGEFAYHPDLSYKGRATSSLTQLKETLPEIKDISLVVSWFADNTDISSAKIKPGRDIHLTDSINQWKVGSYNDASAYKIRQNTFGFSNYGGTQSDESIIEYIRQANKLDLGIVLYPFVLVDDELKSWRGHISGKAEDIIKFFEEEYKPFILHYANLIKDQKGISAFIIGSELKSLTSIKTVDGRYPFIDKLIELAQEVKKILGENIIVTYAADWSEYHTSNGVDRPLDKLWADSAIDVVGIDAYFPLTDTKKKHLEVDEIKEGWISGEGYDYWYDENGEKQSLKNEYWNQWKNLKYWWSNRHFVDGKVTEWLPAMKPIWFTEFGIPSITMATNQPNIFYNPEMKESGLPKHSDGNIDFTLQRKGIRATLEHFQDSDFVQKLFLWNWDARAVDWQKLSYYRDGNLWSSGHWIDGKIVNPIDYLINLKGHFKYNDIQIESKGVTNINEGTLIELSPDGKLSFNSKNNINIEKGAQILGGEQHYHSDRNFNQNGTIKSTADLTISALNVLITGLVKSGKDLSLEAIEKLTIKTLANVVKRFNSQLSTVEVMASVIAEGATNIKAGEDILVEGAFIEGDMIRIESKNGSVQIIPLKLFNEVVSYSKKLYSIYKALSLQRSELESKSKNIFISGANILLSGVISKSGLDTDLITLGKTIVESPKEWLVIENYGSKKRGGLAGIVGGTKLRNEYYEIQTSVNSEITSFRDLNSISEGDQLWEGAKIKAYSAKLNAGTPEKEARLLISPANNISNVRIINAKTGFDFKIRNGSLDIELFSIDKEVHYTETQIPTIFQVEDKFYGYASGQWILLSSKIDSKGNVELDSKNILLTAAPDLNYSFLSVEKNGIGIGFSHKTGEYAVDVSMYKDASESLSKVSVNTQRPIISANKLIITADKLEDYGAEYNVNTYNISTKTEVHGILKDVIERYFTQEELTASLKFGLKSNIANIINRSKAIVYSNENSIEDYVNTAFNVTRIYDEMLVALSKRSNNGIAGGVWFEVDNSKVAATEAISASIPTVINAREVISDSDELYLNATQYKAYNAYFKAKYLNVRNASDEVISSIERRNHDALIPISGAIPPSLGAVIEKANQYKKIILNTQIFVSNSLTLDIDGLADLKGVYISARSLDANFKKLILESVQNIYQNSERYQSAGLGLSAEELDRIKVQSVNIKDCKHIVENISGIIGTERANIVVANALKLNGAIIASAEVDHETGQYTDNGNLTLKVNELFVQHIYDLDEGKTLGASVDAMKRLDELSYGNSSTTSVTKATIGKGSLNIERGVIPENLNRDVNAVQEIVNSNGIQAINAHISDTELNNELKKSIPHLDDFYQNSKDILENMYGAVTQEIISINTFFNNITEAESKTVGANDTNSGYEGETSDLDKNGELSKELSQFNIEIQNIINNPIIDENIDSSLFNSKNSDQSSFEEKSVKTVAQKMLAMKERYDQFAMSHPLVAEYGLRVLNVGTQTLFGGAIGLLNSVRSEITGEIINCTAGDKISEAIKYSIEFGSGKLMKRYNSLSKEEAEILVAGNEIIALTAAEGSGWIKQILYYLDIKKMPKFYTKDGIKIVRDSRLDGYTSEGAYQLLENIHFLDLRTAEAFNIEISKWYDKPPFINSGKVGIFESKGDQKFARVYTEGFNRPIGGFILLESDIKGLNPIQIKDKFDLPQIPTHVVTINVPDGNKIAVGTVNINNYGGKGKGTQFYLLEGLPKEEWLSDIRSLVNNKS